MWVCVSVGYGHCLSTLYIHTFIHSSRHTTYRQPWSLMAAPPALQFPALIFVEPHSRRRGIQCHPTPSLAYGCLPVWRLSVTALEKTKQCTNECTLSNNTRMPRSVNTSWVILQGVSYVYMDIILLISFTFRVLRVPCSKLH